MVWVFQDGNFAGLLGLAPPAGVDTSMPILPFCIAFGLSMDYEVFLLSRIKEEHDCPETMTAPSPSGPSEPVASSAPGPSVLMSVTSIAFEPRGPP